MHALNFEGEIIPASVFLDRVFFVRTDVGTFRKYIFGNGGLFGNRGQKMRLFL